MRVSPLYQLSLELAGVYFNYKVVRRRWRVNGNGVRFELITELSRMGDRVGALNRFVAVNQRVASGWHLG